MPIINYPISNADFNKLSQIGVYGQKITVKGVNNFGEPFEVTSKIACASQPLVHPDYLVLDFGLVQGLYRFGYQYDSLCILQILDEDNKVIYACHIANEVQNLAKKSGLERAAKAKTEGDPSWFYTKRGNHEANTSVLKASIGKPIQILNEAGKTTGMYVLTSFVSFDKNNFISFSGSAIHGSTLGNIEPTSTVKPILPNANKQSNHNRGME